MHFLQEQEDWRQRGEYFFFADIEDVIPDQRGVGARVAQLLRVAEKQRAEKGIKRDPLEFSYLVRLAARADGKR